MEQELNLPYDRALSEAVWRRVAPELTPFAPLPADEAQEACCMAVPTEDVCLRELFQRLSRAEYGHAAMLLHVLENSLTSGNSLLK